MEESSELDVAEEVVLALRIRTLAIVNTVSSCFDAVHRQPFSPQQLRGRSAFRPIEFRPG